MSAKVYCNECINSRVTDVGYGETWYCASKYVRGTVTLDRAYVKRPKEALGPEVLCTVANPTGDCAFFENNFIIKIRNLLSGEENS